MKKILLIALSLFIFACSSAPYDDGTNKNQKITKTSNDDGTSKYAINKNIKTSNESLENNNSNNFEDEVIIEKNKDVKVSTINVENNKSFVIKESDKTITNKTNNTSFDTAPKTINETPKVNISKDEKNISNNNYVVHKNIPITENKSDIKKETNKLYENIKSTYDFFYPTDDIIILKDFSDNKDNKNPGIDFRVSSFTPIKASAPGMVIFSGPKPSLGNSVFIFHNEGFISIYYNLYKLKVNKGDYIKTTDIEIAYATDSFHYELRKQTSNGIITLDPKFFLKKRRN